VASRNRDRIDVFPGLSERTAADTIQAMGNPTPRPSRMPTRRSRSMLAVVLAGVVALGLTGCSMLGVGDPAPTASATPTPTASATAAADGVRFTERPDQTGMPACTAVLPPGLTAQLVPAIADDDPLTEQAHLDPAEMAPSAAGGLTCSIDNGVAALDSVYPGSAGDPMRNAITAVVLPDAADALDSYLAQDASTAGPVSCTASDAARLYCSADVHAGSAWLTVTLERVQDAVDVTPEGMQDRFQALVAHATTTVQDSPLGSAEVPHETGEPGPSICIATRVDAVTATPLVDTNAGTDWLDDISWVALERAGMEWCAFRPSGTDPYPPTSALYGTLPGGSWVVRARIDAGLVDADDRIELTGLGAHDAAFRTCDDSLCTVDVVHDGDWTRYLLKKAVAPDTSAAIEAWAKASFGH
jgi:hypothetical protein